MLFQITIVISAGHKKEAAAKLLLFAFFS